MRKNKEGEGHQENSQEANVVGIIAQDDFILSLDNINDAWVVDLGASFHATSHGKYFQDYVQGDYEYVYLGDDKSCEVVKKGKDANKAE